MNMFGITELNERHACRRPGIHVRFGWKNRKPRIDAEFGSSDWGGRKRLYELPFITGTLNCKN